MIKKIYKTKRFSYFIIITFALLTNFFIASFFFKQKVFDYNQNNEKNSNYDVAPESQGIIQDLYTVEWLDNPTFETPIDPWYNTTEGDISDVNATSDFNQANFEVLGETYNFELIADPPNLGWENFTNPRFPRYPDSFFNDSAGLNVYHDWDEFQPGGQTHNTPSIHWKRNITMPVNMSDYIITSASVEAYFNATVTVSPSDSGGIDCPGDIPSQFSTGDYARFYVLVSDPDNTYEFEVAYNQTVDLGQDSPPTPSYSDTLLVSVPQGILIAILTNMFKSNNYEFTITLGIDIYCEDNDASYDQDTWDSLIFRYLNFTFTYKKKIDKFTKVSWNQIGNTISGSNTVINNGTLNFKYKLDQNWTESSPNSEIRILINDRQHSETIKLSSGNTTFQDAKIGGFDISNLILKDVNITLTIQVFLADTFPLDQKIIISIDDATLLISYTENVIEDTTTLDLFLNSIDKTLEKSIEVTMGNPVNITTIYKDQTLSFIQNASVQLIGLGSPKNLSENDVLEHYNITIHTSNLTLGNNFLTISASKKYYESIEILINIQVLERETDLQLFLDGNNKTLDKSIQMIYGNSGNITITYQDKELEPNIHIDGASVNLTGLGTLENLIENPTFEQYTFIINDTKDLGLGNTFLTINAQKENYTAQSIRFKIQVLERTSYIDKVFLNQTESIGIEIPWNESLNIAITFNDSSTNTFIDNALVQLTGSGISENFTEYSPFNYSLNFNSNNLELGVNFLTISAQKENYTLSTRIITITVLERTTYFVIYINNSKYSTSQFYNSSIGEFLNVTVFYKDSKTNALIDSAVVQLIESGNIDNLTENLLFNFYGVIIEMETLGAGVKFLTVSAKKDNYTLFSEVISLIIREKQTEIQLFLNGTQYFDGETIELEVTDILNITVKYLDNITTTFLNGATIDLIDSGQFNENPIQEYYNITIAVFDLGETLNRLSIIAQLDNYQTALIEFFIQVVERKSEGTLILNQVNKTADPYLELPIGRLLNITVEFFDSKTGNYISGATIQLDGDLKDILIENSTFGQYYLIINTTQLSLGLNIFTIIAERANFQIFTIQKMYINIRRISTNVTANATISIKPGESAEIEVILYNLDFGGNITGATVFYRWQYGQVNLTDSDGDGVYEATISTTQEGTYIVTIYAFLGEDYDFEPIEIVISVVREQTGDSGVYLGLLIFVSIGAAVLTGYLIAYQRVLKFPKAVRKTRKYRRTLKRKSAPSVHIIGRETAFKSHYNANLGQFTGDLKLKRHPGIVKPRNKK